MKTKRIALTGGIATGKSTVARMFSDLGAVVLDADRFARDVVQPGSDCSRKLLALVGPDYFDREGRLRRRELRQRIIEEPALRKALNSILHPSIMDAMEAAWQQIQSASRNRAVVIFDIPLLFETGLQHRFDLIILVYAPRNVQIQRLVERDGVSRAEAEKTLSMQWPIDEKRSLAHFIIDNGGDLDATRHQVLSVWRRMAGMLEG